MRLVTLDTLLNIVLATVLTSIRQEEKEGSKTEKEKINVYYLRLHDGIHRKSKRIYKVICISDFNMIAGY